MLTALEVLAAIAIAPFVLGSLLMFAFIVLGVARR